MAQTGNIGVGVAIEYNSLEAWIAPNRIGFDSGGTTELTVGAKIEGATSGATGVVRATELTSGIWAGGTAAGWIYFETTTGTFQDDEDINRTGPSASSNIATINGTIKGNIGNGNTQFVVKTAIGADAANQGLTAVTSVHHEYASLSAFEAGFIDANHINNTDLTAANVIAHAACYYAHDDHVADTAAVVVNFGTTGANNYLQIYTPTGGAESINNQRHGGKWDDGKYRIEVNGTVVTINAGYARIEGLQADIAPSTAGNTRRAIFAEPSPANANIRISHNLVKSTTSGGETNNTGIRIVPDSSGQYFSVWNNIVFGINGSTDGGIVVTSSNGTGYIYNNIGYDSTTGYYGFSNILKNNISQGNINGFWGNFHSSSTHNITETSAEDGAWGVAADSGTTTSASANKLI
ncbi:MAG: hypothetical protein KAR32_13525, partial [Candidatus Omnitrophica bacterium]|nr:hypothetical protein [Candidatus Omnitrophota bacterium]